MRGTRETLQSLSRKLTPFRPGVPTQGASIPAEPLESSFLRRKCNEDCKCGGNQACQGVFRKPCRGHQIREARTAQLLRVPRPRNRQGVEGKSRRARDPRARG